MNTNLDNIQDNFIHRKSTNTIKGVALIFMFIHHLFTFPEWYVDGISYPYLLGFANVFQSPLRICVPIFAFLTGYFYFFTKKKNYSYSLKKCTDVWVNYFFTFIIFLITAILLKTYDFSFIKLIFECFGLYTPTMIFGWYIAFYFFAMLILPLYSKASEKNALITFFLMLVFSVILSPIFDKIVFEKVNIISTLMEDMCWFPCVAIGYVFAQHKLFFSISKTVKTKYTALNVLISCGFMIVPFLARYFTPQYILDRDLFTKVAFSFYDFVYAPLFIYGLISITKLIKNKKILFPISMIGKYSLSMWFIHCIFFNTCKEYTQWFLYLPKNPILVVLWGLFICLVASYIIMIPINYLNKIKNKLIKW